MAYAVIFDEARVKPFLRGVRGLPRESRVALYAAARDLLANGGDELGRAPGARVAPESYRSWFSVTVTGEGDTDRTFRFLVDDEAAPYGVLHVVWADEA